MRDFILTEFLMISSCILQCVIMWMMFSCLSQNLTNLQSETILRICTVYILHLMKSGIWNNAIIISTTACVRKSYKSNVFNCVVNYNLKKNKIWGYHITMYI